MKWIVCFLLMACYSMNADAQNFIRWHNGMTFSSSKTVDITGHKSSEMIAGKYFRLLQFNHLLSESEIQNLSKDGIEIMEYIPDYSYLVSITNFSARVKKQYEGLIATYELSKNYKFSRQLLYGNPCIQEADKYKIVVKLMKGIPEEEILTTMRNYDLTIDRFYPENQILYIKVDNRQLDKLAEMSCVQFIDCESSPGEPEDREGRSLHRVNLIASNSKENLFLDGKGVKVMVRDDGLVGPHIDFHGRIYQDVISDIGTHGDGVSGILTGAGNYDPLIEGMAPGAELYVINYQPDFLDKTLDFHKNDGVVITNSSYSNGCNAGYTIETQVVDKQIFENPELIHVFSAGNSNGADCGYGAGNQWGNITGGHKLGKNALTVANLRLDGTLETSSSRGPAKDGRLKPEISARGTNELSTAPGNGTQVFGGTSAAAPGVAGVCALLYEAYKSFNNGKNPESALIKAAIMNTATDIGTPGPDYQFGFGVIDAYRAYKLIAEKKFAKYSIQHGEVQEYQISLQAGNPLAKFMIYWAEQESSLLAGKALINDLDFEVIDPNGNVHKSWVLNPAPNPLTLAQGAGKGIDTLNNHEQVSILNPVGGVYKIRVTGKFLPSNRVGYYLLSESDDKILRLNYPIGGERFNITESTQVHYTSYGSDSIKIFLSTDAGRNWQTLGVASPDSRLFSIFIPNNISSDSCLVEIVQGNLKDRSGFFTITNGVQGFRINTFCPNEMTLSWKRTSKDSFQIYHLGDKYMDPLVITSDTSITLVNDDPRIRKWFSIAGFDGSALSNRELAISTPDTLVGCGITRDLALASSEANPPEYFSCGDVIISPVFKVINRTNKIQSGFYIKALSKNQIVEQYYTESIDAYDTLEVLFNEDLVIENFGAKEIVAWLDFDLDENPFNDTIFIPVQIIELHEKTGVYPMLEGFSDNALPVTWIQRNEAPDSKWNVVKVKNKQNVDDNALMFENQNSIYNGYNVNLISKTADLTNAVEPYLYLDFVHHHLANNSSPDKIRVKVKEVCGKTHREKILLSGTSTELNTVDTSGNQNWQPVDTAWFYLAYDLSEFKGSKIIVEFEIERGRGDRTFLDNVEIREKIPGTEKADFNMNPNPGCLTKNITFNDSSTINGYQYKWDVGLFGIPRYYTGKGPFNTKYTSIGTKRIILKIKSDINNDAILIKELPLANTASVNYNYTILTGRTVRFNNTSVNAETYLWDFGDGTTSTEKNPVHTFDSAKVYRVKLTIANPCGTYSRSVNVDLTLTQDENIISDKSISIFPNPASKEVMVKCREVIHSFSLYSADGKLVGQQRNIHTDQIIISLNDLPSGIYTLKVGTASGEINRKLEKK